LTEGGAPSGAARRPAGTVPGRAVEPGRTREALLVALGATLALAVSVTLQQSGFLAATMSYFALQRLVVCSWRNLPGRLVVVIGTGLAIVPIGGFLVQQGWMLLPAFFLVVTTVLYLLPLPRHPFEGASILFATALVIYGGVFDPAGIAVGARNSAVESAIGIIVATVVTELFGTSRPRARLTAELAEAFARNRERFRLSMARYRGPAAGDARAGEVAIRSTLSGHLQLLDQVRQEGIAHPEERTLVALATAAERCESYVTTVDGLSRQAVGRTYRALLDAEVEGLAAAVERGLAAFENRALELTTPRRGERVATGAGHRRATEPAEPEDPQDPDDGSAGPGAWVDLRELVAALEARQLEVRRAGALEAVNVAESANTNALVRALAGLADVLHASPEDLERMASGEEAEAESPQRRAWPRLPPLDHADLRYALQAGLGTTLALVIGLAANLPELATILFNPLLVAQTSYGATIRRAELRLLGVAVGGALGVLVLIAVMPNTNDLATYLTVCFAITAICQWFALGSPTNWYFAFQVAITFFVVVYGVAPVSDVHAALWRAWGTFLGTAILFGAYRVVAPDYAGRQLVARLGDLLRSAEAFLPSPDRPGEPLARQIERRLDVGRAIADLLRLADEVRFERRQGVDPDAAVDAIGIAMRIAYRAGLIARGRAIVPLPPLSAPTAALLGDLEMATRERVRSVLAMLAVRASASRPGKPGHERACARAALALGAARPDVSARVRRLVARIEETHFGELAQAPPRATGELLGAIEHYRRIGELLPRLDDELARALLPGRADAVPDFVSIGSSPRAEHA
jgi:hypothetical protein